MIEAPGDETLAKHVLTLGAGGNLRTLTPKAPRKRIGRSSLIWRSLAERRDRRRRIGYRRDHGLIAISIAIRRESPRAGRAVNRGSRHPVPLLFRIFLLLQDLLNQLHPQRLW